MKESRIVLIILAVTFAAFAMISLINYQDDKAGDKTMPWQSYVDEQGATVAFGLTIGVSDLTDSMRRFGSEVEASLFEDEQKNTDLEVFFPKVRVGGIDGKLILNLELNEQVIQVLGQHIKDSAVMPSGVRKTTFEPVADAAMFNLRIHAITFVPRADLPKEIIVQRFGEPDSIQALAGEPEYWYYPHKGLRIIVDDEAQEMLEYYNSQAN